jgi:hypothetical protein
MATFSFVLSFDFDSLFGSGDRSPPVAARRRRAAAWKNADASRRTVTERRGLTERRRRRHDARSRGPTFRGGRSRPAGTFRLDCSRATDRYSASCRMDGIACASYLKSNASAYCMPTWAAIYQALLAGPQHSFIHFSVLVFSPPAEGNSSKSGDFPPACHRCPEEGITDRTAKPGMAIKIGKLTEHCSQL